MNTCSAHRDENFPHPPHPNNWDYKEVLHVCVVWEFVALCARRQSFLLLLYLAITSSRLRRRQRENGQQIMDFRSFFNHRAHKSHRANHACILTNLSHFGWSRREMHFRTQEGRFFELMPAVARNAFLLRFMAREQVRRFQHAHHNKKYWTAQQ